MKEAEPHKTMFDFEQYLQAQFGAPKQETTEFAQTKVTQFKFTPTMSSVHVDFAKPKQTPAVQQQSSAISDLLNLKTTNFLNRKEAQQRAGLQVQEKTQSKITMQNSAFG